MSNDLNTLLGITSLLGIGWLGMIMYKQSDESDGPLTYESDEDVEVDLDDFDDEEDDDEDEEYEDEEDEDEEDEKPKPKKRGRPTKK